VKVSGVIEVDPSRELFTGFPQTGKLFQPEEFFKVRIKSSVSALPLGLSWPVLFAPEMKGTLSRLLEGITGRVEG
jgi:hypothetical protein